MQCLCTRVVSDLMSTFYTLYFSSFFCKFLGLLITWLYVFGCVAYIVKHMVTQHVP